MKIGFYLAHPDAEPSMILVSVSWNKLRLRTTAGMSVSPKLWDKNKQLVKSSAANSLAKNAYLKNLRNQIENFYLHKKNDNAELTQHQLKNFILNISGKSSLSSNADNLSIIQHFQDMIDKRSAGTELNERNGKPFGIQAIKSYTTTLNHLRAFQIKFDTILTFDDINKDFYSSFTDFLFKNNSLVNNSVGNIIKNIKVFMKRCNLLGLHKNLDYQAFKVYDEETELIYLTETELNILHSLDLDPSLNIIRDTFLIQCYTGLRYSDLIALKTENINYDDLSISIYSKKTESRIIVPILPPCYNILKNYDLSGISGISNQKFNKDIKILCKLAAIDTPITITHNKGKSKKVEVLPKYETVSSHTARRTFISIALIKGFNPEIIRKVTGHKSTSSFSKYNKILQIEAADMLRKAW